MFHSPLRPPSAARPNEHAGPLHYVLMIRALQAGGRDQPVTASTAELAQELGISRYATMRALQALKRRGYVNWRRTGRSNRYAVHFPPLFETEADTLLCGFPPPPPPRLGSRKARKGVKENRGVVSMPRPDSSRSPLPPQSAASA